MVESQSVAPDLLAQLDLLLQQHHDRLLSRLQVDCCSSVGHRRLLRSGTSTSRSGRKKRPVSEKHVHYGDDEEQTDQTPPGQGDAVEQEESDLLSSFSKAEEKRRQASLSISRAQEEEVRPHRSLLLRESLEKTLNHPWMKVLPSYSKVVMQSYYFECVMSLLTITNALYIGVEVEWSAYNRSQEAPDAFWWLSVFYCAAFTIELVLRLLVEGTLFFYKDNWRWNYFDLVIVAISVLELTVGSSVEAASQQVPSIRLIRMGRVIRILRIARIMRQFRSLRVLVYSVFNTLRSLMWTLMLLGIIMFVFAIVFAQATTQYLEGGNTEIEGLEEWWGTVSGSILTLFSAISGGVSWHEIALPLLKLHVLWFGLYAMYFAFTYFAVLNVVTGVFCQTAIESANRDHDLLAHTQREAKQQTATQLKKLFSQVDVDNSGSINLDEFEKSLSNEKVQAYFTTIDISVDEAFSLFKLLDHDGSHEISIEQFVNGCLKLRGQAKSIDLAAMLYETRWNFNRCFSAIKAVEERCLDVRDCFSTEPFVDEVARFPDKQPQTCDPDQNLPLVQEYTLTSDGDATMVSF